MSRLPTHAHSCERDPMTYQTLPTETRRAPLQKGLEAMRAEIDRELSVSDLFG